MIGAVDVLFIDEAGLLEIPAASSDPLSPLLECRKPQVCEMQLSRHAVV
jgi:hypothetical protein